MCAPQCPTRGICKSKSDKRQHVPLYIKIYVVDNICCEYEFNQDLITLLPYMTYTSKYAYLYVISVESSTLGTHLFFSGSPYSTKMSLGRTVLVSLFIQPNWPLVIQTGN